MLAISTYSIILIAVAVVILIVAFILKKSQS